MTPEEIELIDLLGSCMNKFAALPVLHPSDKTEFAYAIHLCQNLVFARDGMKEYGWINGRCERTPKQSDLTIGEIDNMIRSLKDKK